MGFEPRREGKHPAAQEFVEQMKEVHEEAQATLKKAQDDMKVYADCHRSEAPEYKVSNKVMLSTQNLNIAKQPTRKLTERWAGPYRVTKIVLSNAIQLDLPPAMKIHPVVNVSHVKPWKQPMEGQNKPTPPPIEIQGEEEYEVEEVLDSRRCRGIVEYRVRWKGYMAEHDTWEPALNLEHAKAKVKVLYQKYPTAVRRVRDECPMDLPGRYTAKMLHGVTDEEYNRLYYENMERAWVRWKGCSLND